MIRPVAAPHLPPMPTRGPRHGVLDRVTLGSEPPLDLLPKPTGPTARERIAQSLERMVGTPVAPDLRDTLTRALEPYGAGVIERLERNGLRVDLATSAGAYPHYRHETKTVTLTVKDLRQDGEVPFRDYMIVHEFAHALDFLYEPAQGPLSERADLGIAAHRTRLGDAWRPLAARYRQLEARLKAEGRYTPPPGFPATRPYHEDFVTIVERTLGERLPERPARGHLTILDRETRPTEYFADAVYVYLHQDPVRTWRYPLIDGRPTEHAYPPVREDLRVRDPRMHAALTRFFAGGGRSAADLAIPR